MNDSMICDDRANDEADRHAQMMQEQKKEKVTFAGGHTYEIKDDSNEE